MGSSPAGENVANADSGGDRPFDDADRSGDAETGDEARALVRHVAENWQVYAGTGVLVVMVVLVVLAVVRRPVGR